MCPSHRERKETKAGRGLVESGLSPSSFPGSAPMGLPKDIWLILPVVICLSQRLSHACVSTN